MDIKIAILRGINVGGKRKILMADLRKLLESLDDLHDVQTYIQSGNVVFTSDLAHAELEDAIGALIAEHYGFNVPVIVRSSQELAHTVSQNPFYNLGADISNLHLTFLKDYPDADRVHEIKEMDVQPDSFELSGREVFIYCEGKYHKSTLSNTFFERKLKVGATTRNWKTVLKLQELSSS